MKKTLIILTAAVAMLSVSCNKFDDTNVAPTKLTAASTKALLTNSLQAMSSLSLGNTAVSRLGSLYVQHLSEGPYPGPSLYSDRNTSFSSWYTGPLYNLKTIIDYNTDGNGAATGNGSKDNQIAVAKILMSYYYLMMTDIWGEIPYSEALQGGKDYTPVYDKQQDIYNGLFKTLTDAVAQIKEAEPKVVGDVLLNGDMAAWKRFANTIRMTMALRLSKVDPAKGKTEYAAALAAGPISSNAQNISYKFLPGDPNNYNPWYNNYSVSNRNDYAISQTLTDYMQPKNDPRLPVYAEPLSGNVIKGLPYGRLAAVNIPAAFSRVGVKFGGPGTAATAQAAPIHLFNYPQVLFMRAEAAKNGYAAGGDADAALYYGQAIKASWEMYGVFNQAAYDTYMALPAVAYTPADGLKKIMTEKWVHMYLNSWESWNDWRRTGFPVLVAAQDAVDARGIPNRIAYSTTEASLNGENYNASVARQGADDNYTKLWWAK